MSNSEFPYKRDQGRCDICGGLCDGALVRVVIESASTITVGDTRIHRAARAIYVCPEHSHANDGGASVRPRLTSAPGTSRTQPQREALW
jgi:hypothetical protein